MKLIPVETIPEVINHKKHVNVTAALEEFLHSGHTFAKVQCETDSYSAPDSCRCSIISAVKSNGYPIRVFQRGEDIYLAKY